MTESQQLLKYFVKVASKQDGQLSHLEKKVMLSNFLNRQQKNSVKESQLNTVTQEVQNNDEWIEETVDDVITVATNDNLTHQQRYENRKNRTYSKHKHLKD